MGACEQLDHMDVKAVTSANRDELFSTYSLNLTEAFELEIIVRTKNFLDTVVSQI